MKLFFVLEPVELKLPHKARALRAPSFEQIQNNSIPADCLYCGNIAWEVIMAKRALGDSKVRELERGSLPPNLIPSKLGVDINFSELLQKASNKDRPVRIALLNGFGTMLGDTALGCGALNALYTALGTNQTKVEFHAFASWNARPGVETVLQSCPAIHAVYGHSPSLFQLHGFDAYIDFTQLLTLQDYGLVYFIDFYLKNLGVEPESIPTQLKKPWFKFDVELLPPTRRMVRGRAGRKVLLVHPLASTHLRSMPAAFVKKLITYLIKHTACNVALAVKPDFDIKPYGDRLVDLSSWSAQSLQHLGAIVQTVDAVVSVDTLVIHLANAANKVGVDILTASEPHQSVPVDGCLHGIVLPGARELPGWMKHKALDDWPAMEPAYQEAWDKLDLGLIIEKILNQL